MKKKPYELLRYITFAAFFSRVCILILQFLFNIIIPDHQSDGFISPANSISKNKSDHIVSLALGGFFRWDAQYFIHISIYGYVYEHTLAFFPGFPCCIRIVSVVVRLLNQSLNETSIHLISATVVNFFFFILTARTLFLLTYKELKNDKVAYWTSILFCINPASIFFSAPYSETLFSYFTFKSMLHDSTCISCFYVALSTVVRSNGIVNVGFPLYREIKRVSKGRSYKLTTLFLCKAIYIVVSALCMFAAYQMYGYYQFCSSFDNSFDDNVAEVGLEKSYILAGSAVSKMCNSFIPYIYVQNHYWNVGFLQYFKLKQLPNFILAFPILYFITKENITFLLRNKYLIWTLGLVKSSNNKVSEMFVYVIHSIILSLVCLFFVHIQVTTRLICSSTPIPYWFCATLITKETNRLDLTSRNFYKLSIITRTILIYCLSYCVIGTALFCNFYPWT